MNYIEVLGFIAAILTTTAFLPQTIKIIKSRQTKDISLSMYVMFFVGITLWLTYGILTESYPLILANLVTLIFTSVILFFKIKHG